jgi:Bacteriophage CI repressor helix-turn-helix domain.
MSTLQIDHILARIFLVSGCRTQSDLARMLGIRQSSISDAKRRKSIPPEWLLKLLRLTNVHPDWILTGSGPRYMLPSETEAPAKEAHTVRIVETRPPEGCSSQDLINELVRRALTRT